MEINAPKIDPIELNKLKKDLLNEFINDPDMIILMNQYKLDNSFIKKYFHLFAFYFNDHKICRNCPGIDKCVKKNSHIQIKLDIDKEKNIVNLKYCKCKKDVEARKFIYKFYFRQFEDEFIYIKFKSCLNKFANERSKLINKLISYNKRIDEKGIYLSGDKETGKSYILKLFSIYLAKNEKVSEISFINWPDYTSTLRYYFNYYTDNYDFYIEKLQKVQILFLDDLGKEKLKDEFILKKVILPIFKYRYENKLPIFISSNFSINDLFLAYPVYSLNKEEKILFKEILSKMFDTCELKGMSYNSLK